MKFHRLLQSARLTHLQPLFCAAILVGCLALSQSLRGDTTSGLSLILIPAVLLFLVVRRSDQSDFSTSRIEGRPVSEIGRFFCIHLLASFIIFYDVWFQGRTLVSYPFLNFLGDPRQSSSGYLHTKDAWAGFLIEAPGILFTQKHFAKGVLPLWNHHEAAGTPFLANGETAVFSLIQAPLHLATGLAAWDYFALARMIVAAVGTSLLGRYLGFRTSAAAGAGILFAFSGHMVQQANLVHLNGEIFTPFIILCTLRALDRPVLRNHLWLGLTFGLALNGGNPQPAILAALLASMITVAGPSNTNWKVSSALKRFSVFGGCLASGVLLTAASLLPLAEILPGSVTRVLLQGDRGNSLGSLLGFLHPLSLSDAEEFGIWTSSLWTWGVVAFLAAILGASLTGDSKHQRLYRVLALFLALSFATILTTAGSWIFGEFVPILRSVNWPKYVGTMTLVAALFVGRFLDRSFDSLLIPRHIVLTVFLLLVSATLTAFFTQSATSSQLVAGATASLVSGLLCLKPVFPAALARSIFLLLLVETVLLRPVAPERPDSSLPPLPRNLGVLQEQLKKAEKDSGQPVRVMAVGDLIPPMLSANLGWLDIRSVSPVPLRSFHEFSTPYFNCGEWPPYLLLGASRQLLMSPLPDLLGVRYIVINDHRLLTGQLDRKLEQTPRIAFGELHRTIDFETLNLEGLRRWHIPSASFELAEDGLLSFSGRTAAKSLRIAIECRAQVDSEVVIKIHDSAMTLHSGESGVLDVQNLPDSPKFEFSVSRGGPVEFLLKDWEVDRYTPKDQLHYRYEDEWADLDSRTLIIENKFPLPIARFPPKIRRVATPAETMTIWNTLVREGSGWDWRNELIVAGPRNELNESGVSLSNGPGNVVHHLGLDDPSVISLEVEVTTPGWLHIAAVNDGSWRARHDGQEIPIFSGNGPFMAIPVQETGRFEIRLNYEPRSLKIGLAISLLSLGIWSGLLALTFWRSRVMRFLRSSRNEA